MVYVSFVGIEIQREAEQLTEGIALLEESGLFAEAAPMIKALAINRELAFRSASVVLTKGVLGLDAVQMYQKVRYA